MFPTNYTLFQIQGKLLSGQKLTWQEFITLLCSPGSRGIKSEIISSEIVKKFPNPETIRQASVESLLKIKGVGLKKALLLKAVSIGISP